MLLSSGCQQSAVKAPESLVGAKSLPTSSELVRETIQINRWGGPRLDHFLSYELRPDNSLTVTHSLRLPGGEKTLGKEAFHLAPDLANQLRTSLWRIRPQTLRGVEYDTLPTGCHVIMDAVPEAAVAFIDVKERIGISSIPPEADCQTEQARQARLLLSQALKSLPASKVATDFLHLS